MPNLTQMSRLLRALRQEAKAAKPAGDLEEIMARLPKAPPEVEARVLAEIEARDRARREMYKVPEVDKTKGKKALAEARRILMTPEERAAYEAQLREQGLQSFLEPSAVKNRLYHGTTAHDDYADEEGQAFQQFTGRPTWFAQEPYTASGYSKGTGSTYPVYAQIKNPLKIGFDADDDAEKAFPLARKLGVDVKHIMEMQNPEKAWEVVNHPSFIDAVENAGYDGIQMNEGGYKTYGVFDPRKIKSATGNRGTYDITDPDITKAEGGLAQYGLRHSGEGVKGKGYFGLLPNKMDGVSTEISVEDETGEYPLIVPTLTAEELDRLLAGGEPTPEMLDKASSWAATRRKRGESPFASPTELRMPRPKAEGGLAMQAGGVPTFMKLIKKLTTDIKKAEKAGDLATSLEKRKELNNAIQFGVNDPLMPRAQPLTQAEIRMYAERMAPQVAGELTRGVDAKTVAGKSQKQFKREQTLPVDRKVLPGAVDPSAPLPYMTLEDQKGSVLLGLPGDPTLARVSVSGIGDVPFEQAVTQHGGPRYGDDEKLWASNLSAATGLLNAADRASRQFGDVPVIASYMKMPTGFGFAQHYLETLLQYQRPDLLNKAAREALEKDIKEGFVKQGKRVAFPNFPGFDDLGAVAQAAENDSNLRKHIAAKLGTSEKYGLRPAADVQFAVSHPELTNLETGASGFTLGELIPGRLTESAHPTYSHDIPGKVLGQMQYSTPYDLLYRDQLELIRKNPEAPEFNTLKMLGARQKIDEQLVNEINEYQERMRQLLGRKKGGAVKKAEGGSLTDLPDEVNPSNWREHLQNNVRADARALLGAKDGGVINLDELIEKSLKKKDGGVINLDELIDWTLAKAEHRKMKEGGAVKMADGGQAFPLQRPEEVTDLKPRPRTKRDELLEMLSKGVGSVHEFMAKPFGYENPPGEMVSSLIGLPGTAKTLDRMAYGDPLTSGAGMTTNLLPETTEAAFLGLGAAPTALKMTKNLPVGMSIKPTTTDLLDLELASKMKASPTAVVPEAKAGKVKAPANPVGFYNPAEKAALNLQRKKGSGSAFISDLKKQPGVTDERIAELGLTDLASNPNVTREDVIVAVEQNRIPLRESVRRPYDEAAEYSDTISGIEDSLIYYRGGVKDVQAELERVRKMAPNSPLVKQYEDKLAVMRDKVDELEAKLDSTKPAKFGPDVDESYSLPGGEDYREIRVRLPSKRPSIKNMSRDEYNAAIEKADREGISDFMHQSHHDNEPNVLFHLRVANHVDEEGKRGLLIDELQSDWHQMGREKGYGDKLRFGYSIVEQEPGFFLLKKEGMSMPMASGTKEEIMDRARHYNAIEKGVPNAPFKDNWYQLGLKRAIKEAVDTGMDRVYLTTGARQADRYDLSKQIDSLVLDKSGDGYLLTANREGSPVLNEQFTDPKKLESLIGKEASKKLLEKVNAAEDRGGVRTAKLAGVDLKVGGEGMKQYYDKNYKNYLEKYAKQHGGKLGETRLPGAAPTRNQLSTKDIENMMDNPEFKKILDEEFIRVANEPRVTGEVKPQGNGYFEIEWSDGTKMGGFSEEGARGRLAFGRNYPSGEARAWNAALKRFNAEPVYYIDLTDAMRESAKKGQSYADGGGVFNTDPDITDAGRIIPEHTI